MRIELRGKTLVMSLDERDWKFRGGAGVRALLAKLKEDIPSEERSYDEDRKEWLLPPEREDYLRGLRQEYLTDPNQLGLFGAL